jgi:hypothetical protein
MTDSVPGFALPTLTNLAEARDEGWVTERVLPILPPAHPLEKSATSFKDTSIHRLSYWQVNLRAFGASSSENEAPNVVVTGLYV